MHASVEGDIFSCRVYNQDGEPDRRLFRGDAEPGAGGKGPRRTYPAQLGAVYAMPLFRTHRLARGGRVEAHCARALAVDQELLNAGLESGILNTSSIFLEHPIKTID
jgi:hypothetical protein